MKKIIILFVAITFQLTFSQENTLISTGVIESGTFGAPVFKFTKLNNQNAFLVGARGGWIINHSFVIGGGIYGLAGNVSVDTKINNIIYAGSDHLRFGYGGMELEYVFSPMNVAHFSAYILLGVGGITYRDYDDDITETSDYHHHSLLNAVFVAEPAINLEINVTEFMRVDFGLGYRYVSQVDYQTTRAEDLTGVTGMITFKFGKF